MSGFGEKRKNSVGFIFLVPRNVMQQHKSTFFRSTTETLLLGYTCSFCWYHTGVWFSQPGRKNLSTALWFPFPKFSGDTLEHNSGLRCLLRSSRSTMSTSLLNFVLWLVEDWASRSSYWFLHTTHLLFTQRNETANTHTLTLKNGRIQQWIYSHTDY